MNRVFTVICRHIVFLDTLKPKRILLAKDDSLICHTTLAYVEQHGIQVITIAVKSVSNHNNWYIPEGNTDINFFKKMIGKLIFIILVLFQNTFR